MKSRAMYFKAAPDLVGRIKEYKDKRAISASAAVVELIEVGLDFVDRREIVGQLIEALAAEKQARTTAEQNAERSRSDFAQHKEQWARNRRMLQSSYNELIGHLRVTDFASCPETECRQILSAYDVIVEKRCPSCGMGVSVGSATSSQTPLDTLKNLLMVVGGVTTVGLIVKGLSSGGEDDDEQ